MDFLSCPVPVNVPLTSLRKLNTSLRLRQIEECIYSRYDTIFTPFNHIIIPTGVIYDPIMFSCLYINIFTPFNHICLDDNRRRTNWLDGKSSASKRCKQICCLYLCLFVYYNVI